MRIYPGLYGIPRKRSGHHELLTYYLKNYLSDISYLSKYCYYFSYDSEEEKSDINDRYFILIIELFKIILLYTFVYDSKQEENFKQYVNTFHNFLFIKNIILKSFFKTTFYKIIDKFEYKPEIPLQLIRFSTLIKGMHYKPLPGTFGNT